MANQYGYPPPPPPPPQAGPPSGYPPYQQPQYGAQQSSRGGGRGRGRGANHNHGGRGDFHASSPYNSHAGGYNGPGPVGNGYVQQNSAPYIGPQPPQPPAPANGYPPQQWHEQSHHPPPHQQQLHHQQAPPPVPLSAQNYHPNYAPQVYQQPQPQPQQPQYGPQQPPFQHSPPQNSYAQYAPPSQPPHQSGPPPQQWQGPPQPAQPPYNGGGRGRGRGGHSQGRGGYEAPLMGPPIRMGFDSDRPEGPMPQASNGFPPPYAGPQHSPPLPFSQPAYQGYPPPQNFSPRGQRPPLDPNPYYGQNSFRGRGGFHNRGGKRDLHSSDKIRHRNNQNRASDPFPRGSAMSQSQKPVAEDGVKSTEGKKKKKKKRKTNTLGLTPRTEEYEDSEEEDDADEEARLAATIDGFSDAKEPSDLVAWLAERRARWPTKARREAKEAELAKRRAQAAEQSVRDKAKAKKDREEREATESAKANKHKNPAAAGESKLERQRRKAEKLRLQLERAEKKVQDAMKAGMKRKREGGDSGDEVEEGVSNRMNAEGDTVDQVIAKATASSAVDEDSDSSSDSSEYTSASDSDDSQPENMTSHRTAPAQVPPPKKQILQRQCKYFSTGGICGKKGKCRFVHDQSVRDAALREKDLNGGRMTLAQRLVQNDKEKDDLLVLKSIKYLYEKGMLEEPQLASASSAGVTTDEGTLQESLGEDKEGMDGSESTVPCEVQADDIDNEV